MTALTVEGGEGDLAMAHTTVFTFDDLRHSNKVSAYLRQKDPRMTVAAGEPLGMYTMAK